MFYLLTAPLLGCPHLRSAPDVSSGRCVVRASAWLRPIGECADYALINCARLDFGRPPVGLPHASPAPAAGAVIASRLESLRLASSIFF